MNISEARALVGHLVMSRDPGEKTAREMPAHGPWRLLGLTKGGLAFITNGREERRVAPRLLDIYRRRNDFMNKGESLDYLYRLRDKVNLAITALEAGSPMVEDPKSTSGPYDVILGGEFGIKAIRPEKPEAVRCPNAAARSSLRF